MAHAQLGPVSDEQFNSWIFGSAGAAQFRRRIEFSLTARVSGVDRICLLTDAQRKKLYLAGRGDIKRFFDRVDAHRRKAREGAIDAATLRVILQEVGRGTPNSRPDLFGDESMFAKVLKSTLTADQLARYQTVTRDEFVAHHRSTIKWVVTNMDSTLRLSPAQHRKLEELLVAETQPPRRFGEYDYYGVLFQMSLLPAHKLKRIFDDEQWGTLSLQLAEATRLAPALKAGGFLPVDEIAARPGAGAGSQDEKPQG